MDERYIRQLNIDGIGELGQEKIKNSKILVIGAGGLGSDCLINFAMLGIGHIGIVDDDIVKMSNLNRQSLYTENDIGCKKVVAALLHLKHINNNIEINVFDKKVNEENVDIYVKNYDYIIIATDNIESRLIINDSCIKNNKIIINGAIEGFNAIIQMVEPKITPCIRCLYNNEKDDDKIKNAIAPPCSIVSSMMANIVLIHILYNENILGNNIFVIDLRNLIFDKINIEKNKNCICN